MGGNSRGWVIIRMKGYIHVGSYINCIGCHSSQNYNLLLGYVMSLDSGKFKKISSKKKDIRFTDGINIATKEYEVFGA